MLRQVIAQVKHVQTSISLSHCLSSVPRRSPSLVGGSCKFSVNVIKSSTLQPSRNFATKDFTRDRDVHTEHVPMLEKKFVIDLKETASGDHYIKVVEFSRNKKSYMRFTPDIAKIWASHLRDMVYKKPREIFQVDCSKAVRCEDRLELEILESDEFGNSVKASLSSPSLKYPVFLFIPVSGLEEICDRIDFVLKKITKSTIRFD
jgi:hypothetical protein